MMDGADRPGPLLAYFNENYEAGEGDDSYAWHSQASGFSEAGRQDRKVP